MNYEEFKKKLLEQDGVVVLKDGTSDEFYYYYTQIFNVSIQLRYRCGDFSNLYEICMNTINKIKEVR